MSETTEMPVKVVSTPNSKTEDLSGAIIQSMGRSLGETICCSRVYGDHYRCNWWAKDGDDPMSSVGGRIVRSRFLRATQTPDGLVIEDLTR